MFKKRWFKVTASILGVIFAFLFIGSFAITYLISNRLPKIIEERNDSPYHFKYTDLNFSLINSSLSLSGVEISPKDSLLIKDSIDLTAKIKAVDVIGINFLRLLNEKELAALKIRLIEPDVHYFESSKKAKHTSKESKLGNSIDVNALVIRRGKFTLFSTEGRRELARVHNLSVDLDGVKFNERTREKKIPFTLNDFKVSFDSLYFQINPYHYVKTADVKINSQDFVMNDFVMKPLVSSKQFLKNKTPINTLLAIETPRLTVSNNNWGFRDEVLYFTTQSIKLESLNAKILEQKNKEKVSRDAQEDIKRFFINFDLKVDTLRVKNSRFLTDSRFDFKNIDLTMLNFHNVYQKKMSVDELRLNNAHFTIFGQPKRVAQKGKYIPDFNDLLTIKRTRVQNASVDLIPYGKKKSDVLLGKINLNFNDILLNPKTIQKPIPFTYKNVELTSSALTYQLDKIYTLTTGALRFSDGQLAIKDVKITPKLTREQFVAQLKNERDYYTLNVPLLTGKAVLWGAKPNGIFFNASELVLNQMKATIYRSKRPPDDLTQKAMFSEKLRKMKFDLSIDQVRLVNSQLVYEEETDKFNNPAGKLNFTEINTSINHINSGLGKKVLPDVVVHWKSNFMGAPMAALWKFNPMSKNDLFSIQGEINNLPAQRINSFIQPNLNASVDGIIQTVKFDFSGNNKVASGDYAMKHDKLRVALYRKDGARKRKLISGLGNLLIKKNTRDQLRESKVENVERKQDKSFFNFLWLCILEGLKKTLLII